MSLVLKTTLISASEAIQLGATFIHRAMRRNETIKIPVLNISVCPDYLTSRHSASLG